MIKAIAAKLLLNVAVWSFEQFYNWVDMDKDGKISKEELLEKAKVIDKQSRVVVKILRK